MYGLSLSSSKGAKQPVVFQKYNGFGVKEHTKQAKKKRKKLLELNRAFFFYYYLTLEHEVRAILITSYDLLYG